MRERGKEGGEGCSHGGREEGERCLYIGGRREVQGTPIYTYHHSHGQSFPSEASEIPPDWSLQL